MEQVRKAVDSRQWTMAAQIQAAQNSPPRYNPIIDVFEAPPPVVRAPSPEPKGLFAQLCSWFDSLF